MPSGPEDSQLIESLFHFADEKKAEDPVLLDLRHVDGPASYFFICSAHSTPQLRAISDSIEKGMKEIHNLKPFGRDGQRESGWLVLDYGSVLVHIFSAEIRSHYSLEDLWRDAR